MLPLRLAPPFDAIDPPLRAELAGRHPTNIVHVDLPVAEAGADPYGVAAQLLEGWRKSGVLVRERQRSAYVLRTTTRLAGGSERSRTGVFLAVAAEPFSTGRIRPHERTYAGPKEDRRRLTHATGCNLSPVFLLAPDSAGAVTELLTQVTAGAPWTVCEAIGAAHEIWIVRDESAQRLADAVGTEPAYVADGHHRFETAVRFRDEAPERWRAGAARTLAYVVSCRDTGLEILPTHRLVQGRPIGTKEFLAAASPFFQPVTGPRDATLTAVFRDGAEVALRLREGADLSPATTLSDHPALRSLAVALADAVAVRVVAAGLLGCPPALRYSADAAEARGAARRGACAVALLLPPPRLEEVCRVADAGEVMPPKSTFFTPKVPTGVVLRPLGGDD